MEETNRKTQNDITIRTTHQLTKSMLAKQVTEGTSLRSFLTKRCSEAISGLSPIYSTTEVSMFRHLHENRRINEAHVRALLDSFEKDGYLFTIVYVNEKLEIIDGQHRCEAAGRCGLPVFFMVMPGWGMKEVTILNVNSRNWTILDFMETHARAGNPNYVRFKEFFDEHDFDVTICQLVVTGKRSAGYAGTDHFRLGLMVVDDQQMAEAYQKARRISDFEPFHPLGWKSRNFVKAMLTLFSAKGYNHEHLMQRCNEHPDILLSRAKSLRVDEYLNLLLEKYNFRRSKERLELSTK